MGNRKPAPLPVHGIARIFLTLPPIGAVLLILHLNGFKIANPMLFDTMSQDELFALITGYGYRVRLVDLSDQARAETMAWAYDTIRSI